MHVELEVNQARLNQFGVARGESSAFARIDCIVGIESLSIRISVAGSSSSEFQSFEVRRPAGLRSRTSAARQLRMSPVNSTDSLQQRNRKTSEIRARIVGCCF